MSVYPWKQGKLLLWDFTCSDTLAKSYVSNSSKQPGYVAKEAEERKNKTYENLLETHHFTPIAVETMGTWGDAGKEFIKELGKKIKEQTGEKKAASYLFQSIGIAMQRGNALSVLGTIREDENDYLNEIYSL